MSDTVGLEPSEGNPLESFRAIANEFSLNEKQIAYARLSGVTNGSEFFSFLHSSPHLAEQGLYDNADLSERLMSNSKVAFMLEESAKAAAPQDFSFGFTPPANSPFQLNDVVTEPTDGEIAYLASFATGPLSNESKILSRVCGHWPVRDQGARGTCVSFAATAAYELYLCNKDSVQPDLSEQFLYWAIKHHGLDGIPNKDGTWYEYAVEALKKYGICKEQDWPYNPSRTAPISHNPPPSGAVGSASPFKTTTPVSKTYSARSGKARQLLTLLQSHNGVGIALPVFDSPSGPLHNWGTRAAQTFGFVQGPPPSWTLSGGHAVLCTGFAPDALEPLGGHFIIRNSWSTGWGYSLPDPAYEGPEAGYGQIPASFIDRYLWETCVF